MLDLKPNIHTASGTVMGGPWQVCHVPVPGVPVDDVANAALTALQRVDAQMSNYKSDSDLMRLNAGPLGEFIPVTAEMIDVMSCGDRFARLSDGALNIALGRAVNRWGFGPDPAPDQQPDKRISDEDAARAALGSFALRATPPAVMKHADIGFDLCALAKGYAVDLASQAVQALGVRDFLIEAAGEIYARGQQAPEKPWRVGLELPVPGDERLIFDEIALDGMAVATSGGYRNRRLVSGTEVAHTIDPATGAPLETSLLSVTVRHPKCMDADALATVLYVLGPERGPKFAAENDVAALFLIRAAQGLKEIRSEAFVAKTR